MNLCEVIHHRWPGARQWRHVRITSFIQVTKPIIASRIIRFQAEQINNMIALAVFMFILNILVEQTKLLTTEAPFQTGTWPSASQLPFRTVGNVKSFTQALTYTSSDIHGIRKSICTPIQVFKKIYLAFSIENWMLQSCLRRNSEGFTAFYNIHIVKKWRHSWGTRVLQMSLTPKPHVKMN